MAEEDERKDPGRRDRSVMPRLPDPPPDLRDAMHTIPDSCPTLRIAVPMASDTIPAPPAHDTVVDDLLELSVPEKRRKPRE